MSLDSVLEKLVCILEEDGIEVRRDIFASNLTTYRLGGALKYLVFLKSELEIKLLSKRISEKYVGKILAKDVFILGNGSNVIVSDGGFDGLTFKLGGELAHVSDNLDTENQATDIKVQVGAGELLPKFARTTVSNGIFGCGFYVGIPGSVGGAVAMNAGGHGKQTSDVLDSVKVLSLTTGNIKNYSNSECDFSYRHSIFKSTDLIYMATYNCEKGINNKYKKELDNIVKWRRENQPGGRNIGSVFQNSYDISAGELIEKCSLKGHKIGGAFVSEKHANFIQADENTKAQDVVELIEYVRNSVKIQTGVELINEVRYIGFKQNG